MLGGILIFLNVLAWSVVFELNDNELKVIFFDVGQGDASLIRTPSGHHIIVDGGPNSRVLEKLGKEVPFWKRTIDLMILTHPQSDHITGLIEVLKHYKVENILWSGIEVNTAVFQEWKRLVEKEEANVQIAKLGQRVREKGFVMKVIYTFENLSNNTDFDINDTSVVAKVYFGKHSFLFTGDASTNIERVLIKNSISLRSNVLKVGHHGSKTSSDPEFISLVFPEIAIISVGKDNRYGHPHQQVLETLNSYGIKTLRTDEVGDIKVISNGRNLLVKI